MTDIIADMKMKAEAVRTAEHSGDGNWCFKWDDLCGALGSQGENALSLIAVCEQMDAVLKMQKHHLKGLVSGKCSTDCPGCAYDTKKAAALTAMRVLRGERLCFEKVE